MGVASIKELAEVDTDSAGLAQFTGLYPGQYALVEVATRSGYKLLDKPVYFSIDYQGPKTLVVEALYGGKSIVNEREKVTITIKKYDSKYKKKNQSQAVNLEGAQFGIYTQDPIKNGYNKEIVPKNTQLEVIEYNPEIGGYRFESELPHGTYYIKELKAPKGYKKTGKKHVIDATDGKESYEFELTIYNSKKKSSGKHHKKDKDNNNNGNGGNGGNGNGGNGNGSGIGAAGRTGNGFARNVKTGDTSNALLYVIIALLLMAGCGVWFVRRRRAGHSK
jgi:LPXTG-motif cell wall-anchored protein